MSATTLAKTEKFDVQIVDAGEAKAIHLGISEFGASPERNYSRAALDDLSVEDVDPKLCQLAAGMCMTGFQAASPMGVIKAAPDEVDEIIKSRQQTLAVLKARQKAIEIKVNLAGGVDSKYQTISLEPTFLAATFEELFFKRGTPIKPAYGVVWGFRRSLAFFLAYALRRKLNASVVDFGIIAMTPKIDNLAQRIRACIEENGNRSVGVKELTRNDLTVAAANLVKVGHNQTSLKNIFGINYSEVQRIYPLAVACNNPMYEKLNLLNRIHSGDIKVDALNKEDLRQLCTPVQTIKEGNKTRRVDLDPVAPDVLDEYLVSATAKFGTRERGNHWTPKELKELLAGTNNILLRHFIAMYFMDKTDDRAKKFFDTITSEAVTKAMNAFVQSDPTLSALGIPQPAWVA